MIFKRYPPIFSEYLYCFRSFYLNIEEYSENATNFTRWVEDNCKEECKITTSHRGMDTVLIFHTNSKKDATLFKLTWF